MAAYGVEGCQGVGYVDEIEALAFCLGHGWHLRLRHLPGEEGLLQTCHWVGLYLVGGGTGAFLPKEAEETIL